MSSFNKVAGVLAVVLCSGCDRASDSVHQDDQALARAVAEQEKRHAEEMAALENQKAAQEERAKQAAEAELEAQKSQEAKMASCCEALGKQGFEGRSMEYMKGFDACDAGQKSKASLADTLPQIREALSDNELPGACAQN